jgi:hypothetical protein
MEMRTGVYLMTLRQNLTAASERADADASSAIYLAGFRLFLARVFWAIVALFELAALVDSITGTISQLQVPCISSCTNLQLSAAGVSTLQHVGLSLGDYIGFYLAVIIVSTLVCYTLAAILLWRRSDDLMALLISLMLMAFAPGLLSNGIRFSQWLSPLWAAHVSSLFDQINLIILVLVFFLFPDGHFVPRWTRWIIRVLIGFDIVLVFVPRFTSDLVNNLALLLFFGILISLIITQIYRYRRVSTPVQRQQTKWIVYSLAVTIFLALGILVVPNIAFPAMRPGALLNSASDIVANAVLTLLPVSFGVAILRYRLYDIDIIINRTLVYATLTALLALIYIGSIIAMQALLRGVLNQNNDVVILVSTLAVAALFQPLRHRVQAVIDHRFYRRKYDAARILAAFGATLRNEVDLEQVTELLLSAVQETMQPTHVSLWLDEPQKRAFSLAPDGSKREESAGF